MDSGTSLPTPDFTDPYFANSDHWNRIVQVHISNNLDRSSQFCGARGEEGRTYHGRGGGRGVFHAEPFILTKLMGISHRSAAQHQKFTVLINIKRQAIKYLKMI